MNDKVHKGWLLVSSILGAIAQALFTFFTSK